MVIREKFLPSQVLSTLKQLSLTPLSQFLGNPYMFILLIFSEFSNTCQILFEEIMVVDVYMQS